MEATSKQLPGATSTLSYSRVLQLAVSAGCGAGRGAGGGAGGCSYSKQVPFQIVKDAGPLLTWRLLVFSRVFVYPRYPSTLRPSRQLNDVVAPAMFSFLIVTHVHAGMVCICLV